MTVESSVVDVHTALAYQSNTASEQLQARPLYNMYSMVISVILPEPGVITASSVTSAPQALL